MNIKKTNINIDPNTIYYAGELIKKGFDFSLKDIDDNIVDIPLLKTQLLCADCKEPLTAPNKDRRNLKFPVDCGCGKNAEYPISDISSKMLKHINTYLEIKHMADELESQLKNKLKKGSPKFVKYKSTDIFKCVLLKGTRLHLNNKNMLGVHLCNKTRPAIVRYLLNGKT